MRVLQTSVQIVKSQAKLVLGVSMGALIGGVSSAAVLAAIPDTSGVIHACYKNGTNGSVRIIDSATQSCNANETAASWNSAAPGQFVTHLAGGDFTNVQLAFRNFAYQDLHGSTLANTLMDSSDFAGANLSNTDWNHVTAKNISLAGANLSSAKFSDVIDFTGASLTGADFSDTYFGSRAPASVIGGDFRTVNLTHSVLTGGYFTGSNFSGVNFNNTAAVSGAGFENSNLTNTRFDNIYDTNGDLGGFAFRHDDLSGANFSHPGGRILGLVVHDSTVTGTDFSGVLLQDGDLRGVDFSSANLTGVTWLNIICPDGTNSDDNNSTCVGHLIP